jgi:hypothetical protein
MQPRPSKHKRNVLLRNSHISTAKLWEVAKYYVPSYVRIIISPRLYPSVFQNNKEVQEIKNLSFIFIRGIKTVTKASNFQHNNKKNQLHFHGL